MGNGLKGNQTRELAMRENTSKIRSMAMECFIGHRGMSIKEILKMMRDMGREQ